MSQWALGSSSIIQNRGSIKFLLQEWTVLSLPVPSPLQRAVSLALQQNWELDHELPPLGSWHWGFQAEKSQSASG